MVGLIFMPKLRKVFKAWVDGVCLLVWKWIETSQALENHEKSGRHTIYMPDIIIELQALFIENLYILYMA